MKMSIKMPRMGETVDEVYVVSWNKAPGDQVAVGESLMEVETDKATIEVPSVVTGVIVEQLFKVADAIKTGEVFVIIEVAS
jgi:pyruvate/2-oxoglutarate dehydrogenase complex dihydrolipoamide acyltransferase (E2) component